MNLDLNLNDLKDAAICGVVLVVVGYVLHMIAASNIPVVGLGPHDMNDMKVYAAHLFASGVVTHLVYKVFLK